MPIYRKRSSRRMTLTPYGRRKRKSYGLRKKSYKRSKTSTPFGWTKKQELKYFVPVDGVAIDLAFLTNECSDKSSAAANGYCKAGLLNGIAQGTDVNQREGRQCNLKYLELEIVINPDIVYAHKANQNLVHENVRCMVVMDHCNNQTTSAPALSTILGTGVAGVGSDTIQIGTMTNLDYRKRFTILYDKVFTFGWSGESGGAGMQTAVIKEKIQLNTKMNFSGVGSSQGNISDNALWLYIYSRDQGLDPTVTDVFHQVKINPRIRFTE